LLTVKYNDSFVRDYFTPEISIYVQYMNKKNMFPYIERLNRVSSYYYRFLNDMIGRDNDKEKTFSLIQSF